MEKVVPFRTGYGSGLCAAWYDGSFLFVLFTLSSGADGLVSGTVEYDVFGKVVTETGVFVSSSGGMTNLVFGYAGKPYDPVTGLSDYGFRDYAPSLARFTTVDPIRDGSNWYAYCNSDPVNYVDLWGLQCPSANEPRTVKVTLYNRDPTTNPNEPNTIINPKGDVGHTWLGIDDGINPEKYYGWGSPENPRDGKTHPGYILDTPESNGQGKETSSYTFMMTPTQAGRIEDYYNNLESNRIGYNLGGMKATKNTATMCTESAVNALNYSGGMTPEETTILNAPYAKWSDAFPNPLPRGYENAGNATQDLTSPNPNEMEERINLLNQLKTQP